MPTATTKEKKSKNPAKAKTIVTKEAGGKGVTVKKADKKSDKKAKAKADKAKAGKAKSAKTGSSDKKERGPSHRLRLFEALAAHPNGLNRTGLKEATGGGSVTRIVGSEINRKDGAKPRIKAEKIEGVQGRTYTLTAAGHKALKDGTVDSAAPTA